MVLSNPNFIMVEVQSFDSDSEAWGQIQTYEVSDERYAVENFADREFADDYIGGASEMLVQAREKGTDKWIKYSIRLVTPTPYFEVLEA